jgi:hypothetical protein
MRTAALAQASTTRRDECRTTRTSRISPSRSCSTTRKWSATTALHVQRSAAGQDAGIGATPRATYKIAHICPALLHGVLTRMREAGKQEKNPAERTRLIQDPAYRLPRTHLPRTRVNKGDVGKDRSFWRLRSFGLRTSNRSEACLSVHAGVGLTTPEGVATPDSAAPSSCSCFLSLRDRCFGPATMTTTIAATTSSPK